jgi:hypothetical protein
MGDLELDLLLDLGGHLVGRLFPVLHAMEFCPFCSPHGNDKVKEIHEHTGEFREPA